MGARKAVILKNYHFTASVWQGWKQQWRERCRVAWPASFFLQQNIRITEVFTIKHLLSCKFNLDTACVEVCFLDGSMISIDAITVDNEVVNNMYQQSELDYLIYNDPAAYADLILNGDPAVYLKTVTEYQNLGWFLVTNKSCPAIHRGSSCFDMDVFINKLCFSAINSGISIEKENLILYNNVCTHKAEAILTEMREL